MTCVAVTVGVAAPITGPRQEALGALSMSGPLGEIDLRSAEAGGAQHAGDDLP